MPVTHARTTDCALGDQQAVPLNVVVTNGPPVGREISFRGTSTPLTVRVQHPGTSSNVPYKEAKEQVVQSFDEIYISSLVHRHHGHITKAAAAAGISRKHVYELMREVNLLPESAADPEDA